MNSIIERLKEMREVKERNLTAYWYEFDPTKSDKVNSILELVARAGAYYHGTQDWNESDGDGPTPIKAIQLEAEESANNWLTLIECLEKAVVALEKYKDKEMFGSVGATETLFEISNLLNAKGE